jgi:GAF domain-containing protein
MAEVSSTEASGTEACGTESESREALLVHSFVRLADTLADDFDVVEFLHGLSVDSVRILGAHTAGVMLADQRGSLRLIASSEERTQTLDLFEIQGDKGPCADAFGSGRTVQASADEGRIRWPEFAPVASQAGFRVVCAVPLQVHRHVIGALNLFRGTDERFSDSDLEIAQAMAQIATIALIQERALRQQTLLAEQLERALRSRIVIEQAKGMLAEYLKVSVDDAFQLLRVYARSHNRKLTAVATGVVDREIRSSEFC